MDVFYSLDLLLFYFGNRTLANPVFDILLPFLTNIDYFKIPYALILLALLWKGGRQGRLCVLLVLLTILISDQVAARIIKECVGRIRPCHVLTDVRLLVSCGAGKSFPSNHAVNNFAAAIVFGAFYRRFLPWLLSFASLVAFSRVYCGVHYPSDILGGALLGMGFALFLLSLWRRVFAKNPYLSLPGNIMSLPFLDKKHPQREESLAHNDLP